LPLAPREHFHADPKSLESFTIKSRKLQTRAFAHTTLRDRNIMEHPKMRAGSVVARWPQGWRKVGKEGQGGCLRSKAHRARRPEWHKRALAGNGNCREMKDRLG
jgi:hypothetical protein